MTNTTLRDEIELRRRHLLNEIDELVDYSLHGRVNSQRRQELVDRIEFLLRDADSVLLREFEKGPGAVNDAPNNLAETQGG
jgi:hypothetical protein